jgi:hypothetical protein
MASRIVSIRLKKSNNLPVESHDPVCLPALARVVGERLFKVARVWGNGGKAIADHDDPSLEFFLVVELPVSVGPGPRPVYFAGGFAGG